MEDDGFSDKFLDGSLVFLGVVFAIISVVAVGKLIWVFYVNRPGWSVAKVVHCFVVVTSIPTSVDLFYYYKAGYSRQFFLETWKTQPPLLMLLDTIPEYLFISTYILLCLFWFKIYTSAFFIDRQLFQVKLRRMYVIINAVLYTIWTTILIVIFCEPSGPRLIAHTVEAVFTISVSALLAIVFIICGIKLYFQLRQMGVKSSETLDIASKVWIMTIVFSVVFIMRAPILYIGFFVPFSSDLTYSLRLLTPILLQGLPTCLVLLLLGRRPNQGAAYARINL